MATKANVSIWESHNNPELRFDREMKAFKCEYPLIVGIVLNKATYQMLKNKSILRVAEETPWRVNHGWDIRYLTATLYDGVAVYVRKYQRGAKLFYDLTKLSGYLNGAH